MTAEPLTSVAEIPHQTDIPFFRKWRSFGTGVGIEVGPENLQVTLTLVRPSGIKVLDAIEILRYRERPAAEWGEEYHAFLRKHKLGHLSAAVVLPGHDCISRAVALPGVPDRELASAIQYQLEGLHPFSEEQAMHAFSRLTPPRASSVTLAIAKNEVIEDYATLFDEAGIDLHSFLSPAAAIYSALRVLQLPPAPQFLALHEDASGILIYGESDTHPVYCVRVPSGSDRAVAACASQLRLPEDAPQARLASLLPVAERLDVCSPISFAASLSAALPSLVLPLNILPVDRRKHNSPWRWVPTIVLVLLLMALGVGFASYQEFENKRLLTKLDAEISRLQPRLAAVRKADAEIEAAKKKLELLNTLSTHPREDLDTLRELTRIMPMNSYVSRMDLTRNEVGIAGETEQAMDMLKMIDASPFFKDSEFSSVPSRIATGKEVFQIRTKRESPPLNPAPAAPGVNSTPLPPRIAPPPPLPAQGLRP